MNFLSDERTVLTLDAGGTNFVFSAFQANQEIVESVTLPSNADDLSKCIQTIIEGFTRVRAMLKQKPVAISFAFPGPTDYATGIIGHLNNLPAFKGGVPLGPILQNHFNLPIFINNDGDLYAYGEAIAGFLPAINKKLLDAGIKKQYNNLIGITLGTGFGAGIVRNGDLFLGDNSMAAEVYLLRSRTNPSTSAEEEISIRAIQRMYASASGIEYHSAPNPKDIYEIAKGNKSGNQKAALLSFQKLGTNLGDSIANILTLIDGITVIGGGISGAMDLIFPAMMKELQGKFVSYNGETTPRLCQKVINLNTDEGMKEFLDRKEKIIVVPGTGEKISYWPEAILGVGTSVIGTSKAISLGAYCFALQSIDKMKYMNTSNNKLHKQIQ